MKLPFYTFSQTHFGSINNCGHICNYPSDTIYMVQKKATLSSSTMGNLIKLVPSLVGNTPSLDSSLPILSELASSRTRIKTTPATVSTLYQTTPDELILTPVLIPRFQVTPSSSSTSTVPQPKHLVQGPVYKSQRTKHTSEDETINLSHWRCLIKLLQTSNQKE